MPENTSPQGSKRLIGFFENSEQQSWYPNGEDPEGVPLGNRPVNSLHQFRKYLGAVATFCGAVVALGSYVSGNIPMGIAFTGLTSINMITFSSGWEAEEAEKNDSLKNWLYQLSEQVMGAGQLDGLDHDQWQARSEAHLREMLAQHGVSEQDRNILLNNQILSDPEKARLDSELKSVINARGGDALLQMLTAHRKLKARETTADNTTQASPN